MKNKIALALICGLIGSAAQAQTTPEAPKPVAPAAVIDLPVSPAPKVAQPEAASITKEQEKSSVPSQSQSK